MAKQLSVAEVNAVLEKKEPANKTAEDFRILADSVVKAAEDADKAEPGDDAIERGVNSCIVVAKNHAEQGKHSCIVTLADLNYQGGYRVLQRLKEVHGFNGRQDAINGRVQINLLWDGK